MKRCFFFAVICLLSLLTMTVAEANRRLIEVDLVGQNKGTILNFLRLHPDIASYGRDGGYVHVVADEGELEKIKQLGLPIRVVIDDLEAYDENLRKLDYLDPFHTYFEMFLEMVEVSTNYADIAMLVDIGDGWEKTQGIADRDIWAMKISDNVEVEEPEEAEVLYIGCHHAREIITPEIILYFMHYLVDNYKKDPRITYIINNRQVWLIPMLNPDGHEYVFNEDLWWRKNRRDNGNGTYGVDLNRNYGYMWGYDDIGSSPDPSSQVYRGTAPFSEPESQTIRDFAEAHQFVISFSYHSYGNWLLFPWGYIAENTPDHATFMEIAEACTVYNGYEPGNTASGTIYLVNGDSDDWLYGEQTTKYKVYAFTPEVGGDADGFHPDTSRILPLILENLEPNIHIAFAAEWYAPRPEIAHTPLSDTEDPLGPFPVVATITSSTSPLDPTSLWMYYTTSGQVPFDSLALTPTGTPDEYQAQIPGQGNDVIISYYLSAADSVPRTGYAPSGAPNVLYSFHAGVDTMRPVILHTPLEDQLAEAAPFAIVATITDNLGVAEVHLQYRLNEVPCPSVDMPPTGDPHEYEGEIDPPIPIQVGDLIEYRIVASDAASGHNTAYHPADGFHSFDIIEGLLFDLEADNGGFSTSPWSDWKWGVPTSGPSSAHSGTKVWATVLDGGYSDNSDSRLETPPIELINVIDPFFSFWHWYHHEFSEDIYWDGGNVKISVDGSPFQLITPQGGYDGIIDRYNSVIGGEPAFGGLASTGNFWHREVIDLSPYIGHTVVIRFHFGSDNYVTAPGWYIDDIVVALNRSRVPLVTGTTHLRNTDDAVGPYSITAMITDDTGIAGAWLFYSLDAGTTFVQQSMVSEGDHRYRGDIPGQPYGTQIHYYLEAVDDSSNTVTEPVGAPESTFVFLVTDRRPEISLHPLSFDFTVGEGETIVDTLNISNLGLIDLYFTVGDSLDAKRMTTTPRRPARFTSLREIIHRAMEGSERKFPHFSPSSPSKDLELIVSDPAGDIVGSPPATKPDIVGLYASVSGGVTFQFAFNEDVVRDSTIIVLSVDVDQDVNTGGYPPGFGDGLESQSVGAEYELIWDVPDLYGYGSAVHVLDALDFFHVGSVPLAVDSNTVTATIHSYLLGGDDGNMNVSGMAISGEGATTVDYAPDIGHGVVGEEASVVWLDESPCSGMVAGECTVPVEIRVRGGMVPPGAHQVHIVIFSNDSQNPISVIPASIRTAGVDDVPLISPLPDEFALSQNYPNPFNPTTTLRYQIPGVEHQGTRLLPTTLRVYNLLGQAVRTLVDGPQPPGYHQVVWDGRDDRGQEVASGVYFYRLQVGEFSQARRMVLLR